MNRPTSEARPGEIVNTSNLAFGSTFSPTMMTARWTESTGWTPVSAKARENLSLHPAAMVLHYGQAIFEGLKALKHGNEIRIFRPERHAQRFAISAERLCMPPVPPEMFLTAVRTLVAEDHEWVPLPPGYFYLRPTLIATEAALGVRPASEYLFFVIASPSSQYFKDPNKSLRIWVERHRVRAARGGIGAAKAAGNYAASLEVSKQAKARGCDQVLWLDSENHRDVEELGAANVFFVWDGRIVTPTLGDSVLDGVTRDAILTLAAEMGLSPTVLSIEIKQLLEAIRNGVATEMFACGTAAVIAPIATLVTEEGEIPIGGGAVGPVTEAIRTKLHSILYGTAPDTHHWFTQAWPVKK